MTLQGFQSLNNLLLNQLIISNMIVQPQFPQSFKQFLYTIITQELEAEHMKAQIEPSEALQLFQSIDSLKTGLIYIEDFFSFIKQNGLTVMKKEVKFLCQYFGFGNRESLNFQQFKKYFLQIRNPKSIGSTYSFDSKETFIKFISTITKSFNKIEEMRLKASNQKEELKLCLQKYYASDNGILNKDVLKQCIFDMGLFSRLNLVILDHYVIGDQNKEITLNQLFWKQGIILSVEEKKKSTSSSRVSKCESLQFKRQAKDMNLSQEIFFTSNSIKKDSNDILTQIENIQATIKCKKQMYAERKRIIEQDQTSKKKTIGLLIKKSSAESAENHPNQKCRKQAVLSKFACSKENTKQIQAYKVQQQQSMITKRQEINDDQQLYEFIQPATNIKYKQYALKKDKAQSDIPDLCEIEEIMKKRMPTKTRDQVLSKASSCAHLKIQQIEKRVMGRISNKNAYQRPNEYVSRHIGHEMKSHRSGQINPRYCSLKRREA